MTQLGNADRATGHQQTGIAAQHHPGAAAGAGGSHSAAAAAAGRPAQTQQRRPVQISPTERLVERRPAPGPAGKTER